MSQERNLLDIAAYIAAWDQGEEVQGLVYASGSLERDTSIHTLTVEMLRWLIQAKPELPWTGKPLTDIEADALVAVIDSVSATYDFYMEEVFRARGVAFSAYRDGLYRLLSAAHVSDPRGVQAYVKAKIAAQEAA